MEIILVVSGLCMLNLCQFVFGITQVKLFTKDSSPYGTTYKDWTERWWQWFLNMTEDEVPTQDNTGAKCNLKQSGEVWFLAGTWNGVESRKCNIPEGKAVLLPMATTACSVNEQDCLHYSDSELRNYAISGNDGTLMEVSIDGKRIGDIPRITTDFFNATYPVGNAVKAIPGTARVISDGYYVFLEPLAKGNHNIHFKVSQPLAAGSTQAEIVMDVTYDFSVI